MSDQGGKTEQPTQRRLEKARKEGQFASAKEFVSALQFLVFLVLLGTFGLRWLSGFRQTTRWLLQLAFARDVRAEDLIHVAYRIARQDILPLVAATMGIAVA